MGGPGAGHKSERARLARMANMAKARAARKREPLRWRSGLESRVIEQLVWQWWLTARGAERGVRGEGGGTGEALLVFAESRPTAMRGIRARGFQRKASPRKSGVSYIRPHYADAPPGKGRAGLKPAPTDASLRGGSAGVPAPFSKDALGKVTRGSGSAGRPWAKLRVARLLGVSHTWVNKLVKRFEADPDRMRRRMAAFAPATLEKLERAREETRRQRELGWLRGPIRMRRMKWTLDGKTRRGIVWTRSERQRRETKSEPRRPYVELPPWCMGRGF